MSSAAARQLKSLLDKELARLSSAALETGGVVGEDGLRRLEHLARLVDLHKSTRRPSLRQRWPIAFALVLTLGIVSVLLFARVPVTDIELDLVLSELSFGVPGEQLLSEGLNLTSLGVTGLTSLSLPRSDAKPERTLSAEEQELSARFTALKDGSLNLAPVTLSTGGRVWLGLAPDVPRPFHLELEAQEVALRADVDGAVEVLVAGLEEQPGQLTFSVPRSVTLQPHEDALELDFALAGAAAQAIIKPQLPVTGLSLWRIDELTTTKNTVVEPVSTIRSGSLYFESLGGKELTLRPGEKLRFAQSSGEIRSLDLDGKALRLQFRGSVRGMSTGPDEAQRSLMPTYLEWLQARHGLTLLWGTTLYLFGLLGTVIRWWRLPV